MAMTDDDVLNALAEESSIPRENLKPEATLESLGIGSLDVISVLFTLEDKFGVIIEQTDLKFVNTLQDFVDVVMALAEKQDAAA